jgi:hypothetical protein
MKWNSLVRGATRWWSAPTRFPTAPLAALRKAALNHYTGANPWLHHVPGRMKAERDARSDALPSR